MNDKLELMHGLADGELTAEEEAEAKALAESDPECQREYLWAKSLKNTLHSECSPIENEAGWQACLGRLDEIDRVQKTQSFVGKYAWVMCGVFLVGILVAGISNRALGPNKISSTQVASLLNVPSTTSTPQNYNVETARMIDLSFYQITKKISGELESGEPYVRLSLQDRLGGLVLIATSSSTEIEGVDRPTRIKGFRSGTVEDGVNGVSWQMQGHTFLLASERPTDELLDHAVNMIKM